MGSTSQNQAARVVHTTVTVQTYPASRPVKSEVRQDSSTCCRDPSVSSPSGTMSDLSIRPIGSSRDLARRSTYTDSTVHLDSLVRIFLCRSCHCRTECFKDRSCYGSHAARGDDWEAYSRSPMQGEVLSNTARYCIQLPFAFFGPVSLFCGTISCLLLKYVLPRKKTGMTSRLPQRRLRLLAEVRMHGSSPSLMSEMQWRSRV